MSFDLDLFVIGAGSGGVRAARIAAGHGARVAIAEEYRFGGTCVVRGCVPKKLLVLSSRFRDAFEDAEGFGWSFPAAPVFSWDAMRDAKEREVSRLAGIYEQNVLKAGVTVHHDRAVMDAPHTVRLVKSGQSFSARHILIATGGHPVLPDIPGKELILSSDHMFDLPVFPKRLLVVGGGYIGVEFACLFQRLGAEVTLAHRGDKLLRGFDMDLRDDLMHAMDAAGVTLLMQRGVTALAAEGDARRVIYDNGESAVFDAVMFATGRAPNTQGLGLESLGVMLGKRGEISVDECSRSSAPQIFAVGDVTGGMALTPLAIREGHALADSLFGGKPWMVSRDCVATAVFSTPEIGTVGLSEEAAREKGHRVDIYRTRFRSLKHTLTRRQERTLMKLVVDAVTDRVLGVHILGEDAGEMIQLAAVAVQNGLTKADFDRTVAVHPTAAEELVTLRERV